ncbi:MAG TPA: DUF4124 domain-containing protein [Casimicrobium sp.]|nr:DUF4124 domain-containing protein [Casimicrobium sp.]
MRPAIAFRTVLPVLAMLVSPTLVATAHAQTAIRCDANGKTTYGETPCKPGATATEIAPTQETKQQREDAKAAREQIRRDTAAVDKRMDDRLKRETVHGLPPTASTKKAISEDKPRKKSSASKGKAKKSAKAAKRSKQRSSGKSAAAAR